MCKKNVMPRPDITPIRASIGISRSPNVIACVFHGDVIRVLRDTGTVTDILVTNSNGHASGSATGNDLGWRLVADTGEIRSTLAEGSEADMEILRDALAFDLTTGLQPQTCRNRRTNWLFCLTIVLSLIAISMEISMVKSHCAEWHRSRDFFSGATTSEVVPGPYHLQIVKSPSSGGVQSP
jgi:hypothetical protein